MLKFFNGRRECIYNEGTKIITHSSGSALLIERVDLPYIEIDLEIDSMCRSHANGIEVRGTHTAQDIGWRRDDSSMYICMYVGAH